jgi:hypothetical protein
MMFCLCVCVCGGGGGGVGGCGCVYIKLIIQILFPQNSLNYVTIPAAPGFEPAEYVGGYSLQQKHSH